MSTRSYSSTIVNASNSRCYRDDLPVGQELRLYRLPSHKEIVDTSRCNKLKVLLESYLAQIHSDCLINNLSSNLPEPYFVPHISRRFEIGPLQVRHNYQLQSKSWKYFPSIKSIVKGNNCLRTRCNIHRFLFYSSI